MSYRALPIGNLSNTNITYGAGIQSDASFSYVSVNCDPTLVLPQTSVTDPVNPSRSNPKRYEGNLDIAGKIAVESDVCNLKVANLKVTGTLILTGPAVFKSCVVIEEDGAVCCPLTVRNTNALDPQAGNALCVEGSTVMIPLTDPATMNTAQALLFLDGTQLTTGSNLSIGDYLRIDARPLSSGTGIGIDLDSSAGIGSLDGAQVTTPPTSATTGTYPGLTTTSSGGGIGAILTVVINPVGTVLTVTVTSPGNGYSVGDTLTVSSAQITGATQDLIFTLIQANFIEMTGTGIKVVKGGSSMTSGANSRLLLLSASTENGFDPTTEAITLAEVSGPGLVDYSSGGEDPPGFTGIRKTALWVDCTPNSTLPPLLGYAPVMGFLVDGGTTFRGRNGNGKGHGHVHVAQETPPTLELLDNDGNTIREDDDNNAVFPNQLGQFIFGAAEQFGSDVAGSIQVTYTNTGGATTFSVFVKFKTPFPVNCVPSINITPESKFFLGAAGQVTVTPAAGVTTPLRNEGFIIGPLVGPSPVTQLTGIIHYQVMGVISS